MLETPLKQALRTTSRHLGRLKELGVLTVRDLFMYFPRKYADSRELRKIYELRAEEINNVQVQLRSIFTKKTRSGMYLTMAVGTDETGGTLPIVWFNQPHLKRLLFKGSWVILTGKVKYERGKVTMQSPKYELVKQEQIHTARIVPVYHETLLSGQGIGKISSQWIREKLFPLLPFAEYFQEFLPEEILKEEGMMKYSEAIRNVHFPENELRLEEAKKRLAFEELFLLQLGALKRKWKWRKIAEDEKKQIPVDAKALKKFAEKLPFELTGSQRKVVKEILGDLQKPFPMSRLLQGDVGSGKTVVAAIGILNAVKAGFQACVMAPTEVLAKQHYRTLMKFLQPEGLNIQLITGSTVEGRKKDLRQALRAGMIDVVIGTHALIQEKIQFKKLGLAVIDEQHRFGVKQREMLKAHGSPHLLSLSATPIPRTLALTVYGDQDISIIDEMPKGRQEIITRIVPEEKRRDAYFWVEDQVGKGRQIFIICPLVEGSEILEVKAATEEFKRLKSEIFPKLKLGLLHGRMKPKEKDSIMEKFTKGDIDVLVSTAVVEVGIDVPNATIIIIEGSERFGLAQLHQFRGRVGRGNHQSYCFLFPTSESPEIMQRLQALVKYSSGFKLAEIDLRLRGPGEVYGIRQSGIPDLKMASFADGGLIKKTRMWAERIIAKDPELKNYPALLEKIRKMENIAVDY